MGSVELPSEVFGIEPNVAVMHQVVVAQRAAARAGTHSTKRRGEVRGGGSKPWRQKGTGRARVGSIRSPLWVGGGIAHGPKPRDYSKRVPKKMKRLALRSALSDLAAHDAVLVLEEWPFEDGPSTREAVRLFGAMGVAGQKILVVVEDLEAIPALSVRNIPWVKELRVDQLNTYDVVDAEYLVADLACMGSISGGELEVERKAQAGDDGPASEAGSGGDREEEGEDGEDDS